MDIFTDIFISLKKDDLYKLLLPLAITLFIAVLTIGTTLFFYNKTSRHQQNILKLEHLKILKDLIDKRAYELKAYRLIVEEMMQSYIGYSIEFETVKVLFKTERPSETLSLYKDFRFNLKTEGNSSDNIVFSNKYSPWLYGLEKAGVSLLSYAATTISLALALAFAQSLPIQKSMTDMFIALIISIVFLIASVAFIIIGIRLMNRAGNYIFNKEKIQQMLVNLNKASINGI